MKPIRIAALALLALVCAVPLRAADTKAIETEFNQTYDGKTVALQKFYDGESLQYSATGDFLKGGNPGPWTLDAYVKIKRVRFKGKELVFEGNRRYFLYSTTHRNFHARPGPKVSITIKVDPSSMSVASLEDTMSKVFMGKNEKLSDLVPDYWKPFLLHPNASAQEFCKETMSQMPAAWKLLPADLLTSCGTPLGQPARRRSSGKTPPDKQVVTPPQSLSHPEPPYTHAARAARTQGTVVMIVTVGTQGQVGNVVIVEPVGMGLDDEAVATVSRWRFKPATKEGKPVVVTVSVELTFRLF